MVRFPKKYQLKDGTSILAKTIIQDYWTKERSVVFTKEFDETFYSLPLVNLQKSSQKIQLNRILNCIRTCLEDGLIFLLIGTTIKNNRNMYMVLFVNGNKVTENQQFKLMIKEIVCMKDWKIDF